MKKTCLLLVSWLLVSLSVTAQQLPDGFQTYTGMTGIKKKVSEIRQQAKQKAATLNTEQRRKVRLELDEKRERLEEQSIEKFKEAKERLEGKKQKPNEIGGRTNRETNNVQPSLAPSDPAAPQIWSNYLASSFTEYPYVTPPDPNGDVGANQVGVVTNGNLKFFEKRKVTDPPLVTPNGTSDAMPKAQFSMLIDEFFLPVFRGETFYTSDPRIRYDRLSKRWFITAIEINASFENNLLMMAVSDGETVTDETSFTYFSFQTDRLPHSPNVQYLPFLDFPTTAVDKFSVVIGGREFFQTDDPGGCFSSVDSIKEVGYIIDKQRLLQGQLVVRTALLGFLDFHTFSFGGMYVPQGVHNPDAQATRSFFAGVFLNLDALSLAAVQYNQNNTPVGLSRLNVPVPPFNFPRDITAPGSPMPIDPLDTRLLDVKIHRNKVTNQVSLWTAHAIGVDQKGAYAPDDDYTNQARTASRWYEIGNIYTSPTLSQQGTVLDGRYSGQRAASYFNPSIAASGQGHAVIGGTTSAFDQYLNVFVAGRYFGDAPNTLRKPVKATDASALFAIFGPPYGYTGRWGDYSQTVVDPLDDQTIWTFQEYANIDNSYGVRAVQLKAPPPAQPVSIRLPGNIETTSFSNKTNQDLVVIGKTENRSAYFDPGNDQGGPGYNRLMVKSTGNIQVTDVKVVGPTTIVCKLLTKGAAPGSYQLMITNPDGQSVSINYTVVGDNPPPPRPAVTVNKDLASRYLTSSGVYPNPTEKDFRLVVNAVSNVSARVVVMDLNGKQISTRTQRFGKGANTLALSLSSVSNGTYMVVVYDASNRAIAVHQIVKN